MSFGSDASDAVHGQHRAPLFDRDRPPVTVHATTVTLAAFPSGHATDAAAFFLAASLTLALTIAHHLWVQALLVVAGLFLAALVGLSRLVLGVHWLSDVVAGWALGSAIAITVVTTLWYITTRRQATTGNTRHAQVNTRGDADDQPLTRANSCIPHLEAGHTPSVAGIWNLAMHDDFVLLATRPVRSRLWR